MAEYIIKEVAGENLQSNEKIFETPSGKLYKVRIEPIQGTINIVVLSTTTPPIVINTESVALGVTTKSIKEQIEHRLSTALQNAEMQQEARAEAKNYLQTDWGINLDETQNNPPPVPPETPIVKFLGSKPEVRQSTKEG